MKAVNLPKNLKKRFIAAESNSLTIETVQTLDKQGQAAKGTVPAYCLRALKLKGIWRANQNNQLVFDAFLSKGRKQSYIFKGSWTVNSNQHIEYTSSDGKDTLLFKGYWNVLSAKRVVYILEGSSSSRFEFKVQLESSTLYPSQGQIRFRLGLGLRQSRLTRGKNLLILYGEWRFGRNLKLFFDMDYGGGKVRSIAFGAQVSFGRQKLSFALKDEARQPLGISLIMSRKILKAIDSEAFIRLESCRNKGSIQAGITVPF